MFTFLIMKNRNYVKNFFEAINARDYDKINYYISRINNINVTNDNGFTALHLACFTEDEKLVKLLLEKGANPNIRDKFGRAPIDIVTSSSRYIKSRENLMTLLQKNEQYDMPEKINNILMNAEIEAKRAYIPIKDTYNMHIAKIFIHNMKDINWQDENGQTLLHISIKNNYDDITDMLLKMGINTNIRDNLGYTALHYATMSQNIEAVKKITKAYKDNIYTILESNNILTLHNKTAKDIAKRYKNKEIEKIINNQNAECILKCLLNRKGLSL